MRFTSLKQFYRSNEWDICKKSIAEQKQDINGFIRCEICGKPTKAFVPSEEADNKNALVYHHKTPLTIANVNDYNISLNPEKIQCLCWGCHNKVHERFGYSPPRQVYIVCGAPCSGKTTFVKENMQAGDIVYDLDSIWEAISGQERYTKPKGLYPFVEAVGRELKAQIKMMSRGTAWLILGKEAATAKQRQDLSIELNAEVILMDTPQEECLSRLYANPQGRDCTEWSRYIAEYFERFTV